MGRRHTAPNPRGGKRRRVAEGSHRHRDTFSAEKLERRQLLSAHIVGSPTVYSTIQAAVNAAVAGQTITVDPGTYSEVVTVNKSLTLRGAQAGVDARSNTRQTGTTNESVVNVTGSASAGFNITASDVTIDGFTVQGASPTNANEAGILINPNLSGTHVLNNIVANNVAGMYLANSSSTDAAVIQYNVFSLENVNISGAGAPNGGRAIYTDGGVSGGVLQNVTIDSNFFYQNLGANGTTGVEAAISLEAQTATQTNIHITNNTFENNGKAVLAIDTSNLTITGNTVTDSQDVDSGALRFEGADSNVTIQNNNLYYNLSPAIRIDNKALPGANSAFTVTGNDIYGNGYVDLANPPAGNIPGAVVLAANSYTGTLTMTNNWWGASSGPSGDGSGTGDVLRTGGNTVTFSPWSTSPTVTQASPYTGLAPVPDSPINATNFDHGGSSIGFFVGGGTVNNNTNYRETAVQTETSTDPGGTYDTPFDSHAPYDVTGFSAGQWLAFTLNVPVTGTYRLDLRVANAQTTGGQLHATIDGTNVTGTMTVPNTGGAQVWQTISSGNFSVSAGQHVLQLLFDTNGSGGQIGSFHWLQLTTISANSAVPTAPTNLDVFSVSSSQLFLTWDNTASNQTGFEIDRSTNGTTFTLLTNVSANVTSYMDTSLSAGTSYYYRVEATNSKGSSPSSNIASTSTLAASAPTAPTNLVATAAAGAKINLTWTNTASNQTGFEIDRSLNGTTFALLTNVGATTTTYSDTGLAPATTYFYRVEATNSAGSSPSSNVASATTAAAVYLSDLTWANFTIQFFSTPQNDQTVRGNGTLITLRGTVYPKGVSTQSISQIVYNLGGAYGTFITDVGVDDEVSPSTGHIDFQVLGDNNVVLFDSGVVTNNSTNSAIVHIDISVAGVQQLTLVANDGVPNDNSFDHADFAGAKLLFGAAPIPANLVASGGATSATLNWAAVTGATGYNIYRSTTPGGETGLPIASNVATNSFSNTGLTAGTTYYYKVTAINSVGEGLYSNESAAVPGHAPGIPSGMSAAGQLKQITISWPAVFNAGSYNIYRGTTAGGESATAYATGVSGKSFSDSGLASESTYYYKITSVNGVGESSKSTEISATVMQPPAHVVIVVEENKDASTILGNVSAPYINSLATGGAYFSNFHGITHPSQPNYIALFSGSTQSVVDDTVPASQFAGPDLGSQLIAAGLSFTGYAEDLPAAGSLALTGGTLDPAGNFTYQRKHNPWSDFSDVPANSNQPFTAFPGNFDTLPAVSFVVPNQMDDMHDGTISQGDTWLQTNLSAYATWAKTHNSLLIVTWDENSTGDATNLISTIFYGQQVQTGTYNENANHYNTLRSIEDMYGLSSLGSAATSSDIADAWNATLQTPPPVQNVQKSSPGPQQVTLTWPISVGAVSYKIYRGTTTGGEGNTPIASNVLTTTYNDSGLTAGTTYFYQVVATDSAGDSARSTEVSIAPGKLTPVFTGLSSPTITYGTTTTTLSGTIASGTFIPTGNVSITLNGVTDPAAINQANGTFSFAFDTHALPVTGSPYTLTYSYAGDANFTSGSDTSKTLTDTQRTLHVTASGTNRIYDGTTTDVVTLTDDRVNNDTFTDSYTTAIFANKNVGTTKAVSVSGIGISGAAAGNYVLSATTANATATITARTLTVTATGINKVYDATTAATVTPGDNRVSGDTLTVADTATFANKNVGTTKTVSVSGISLSGTDAANYTLTSTTASTTASITVRTLHVTASGINKIYDGTTAATVNLSDDHLAGDTLTDTYTTATFSDKNVGTTKTVSVTGISVSGTDSGNYVLAATTANTAANITVRTLAITATGTSRVYNATTAATVTLSDNRVGGDTLSETFTTAAFADKNVGTSKTITVGGISLSGTDSGNYAYNTLTTTTANITALTLTASATGVNKTYDGTTTAAVTFTDNRLAGDTLTENYTASFSDKNVGNNKTVTVSGISLSGTDAGNYTLTSTTASTTASISARALTVSATGVNRTYDQTTAATVTLSDNRVAGDTFTDSYISASFADKNAGNSKTVSVSGITIVGADAGNYLFNGTATASANITPRALTVTASGVNKIYDGTTTATATLADNHLAGDTLTDSYTTAAFSDKNVGTTKTVTVSGITLSGVDALNYAPNATATTTANITVRTLTVSATGINRIYDGTTLATATLLDNRVNGDVFTDNYTASFADKNVGASKFVSVTAISLSGSDAANYVLANTTASTTASITARSLTISATGINKPYDRTTAATVTLSDNRVSGDTLSETYTAAAFADKNVGTTKTITVTGISLSGTDTGNYTFNTSANTTANITPLSLTVSATGVNRIYDGTTTATVTLSDNRLAGDTLTDSYTTASFADKNVGSSKTVSVSGISISGTDSGNYVVNTTANTSANITSRTLTVTAAGISRIYDGTTTATVTLSDNRVTGDTLTDTYTAASFADKNVGSSNAVSVSGIGIGGADSGNYALGNATASTTASITVRSLTISATGINRVYEGTTAATVTLSDNRVAGDTLSETYTTASFADKNAGTTKTVSVSGISLSGTDAGNYTFNTLTTTTANITPRSLTVTAAGIGKGYDGTTAATVTLSDNRLAGDTLTDSYASASFADKNVGTSKTVSVSGIGISGTDSSNYTVNTTATTTASITARVLTISATGIDRAYDGTTLATVTLLDNRVSGDSFTDSYAAANFADKNVGTSKSVSVGGLSIFGLDAGNYVINTTTNTTANITPRSLTVSAAGINKMYDGLTTASVALSDNRLPGDTFTDSYTSASFADKNIGNSKTITVSGVSISGPDAGNYSQNTGTSASANILPEQSIIGTALADSITLMQDAAGPYIDWFLNGSSLGQLAITDPSGLTITGNGGADVISLNNGNGNPLPATLHVNGTFTINGLTGSNPLANTTLEIGRSTLFISYTSSSPLSLIQGYLQAGYNNGGWNGTASTGVITSIPAAQNLAQTTAIGYADSADGLIAGQPTNTVELKYTLFGDTSLTGSAGFNDFTRLTQHYNQTTGGTWDTGDFNYDGSINNIDFNLLTRTYNTTLGNQAAPAVSPAAPATTPAAPSSTPSQPTPSKPSSTPAPHNHHAAKPAKRSRRSSPHRH